MNLSRLKSRCHGWAMSSLLAVAASACGKDSTTPDLHGCGLFEFVTIAVGAGTTPEISWTPDCGVWSLTIDEMLAPPSDRRRWEVNAGAKALLRPPIRYGIPPNGALDMVRVGPAPLEPGHTYTVTVFIKPLFEFSVIGSATFTP